MAKYIFAKLDANDTSAGFQTHRSITNIASDLPDQLIGANPVRIGSSIPSPFARIHLFDTAFDKARNEITPAGYQSDSYNELVSDCLDLIELLFMAPAVYVDKGSIRIEKWSLANISATGSLKQSSPQLAKTLEVAAEKGLNLNVGLDNESSILLFIWQYKETDEQTKIIENKEIVMGGTSPFTIVYTSPNWGDFCTEKGLSQVLQRVGRNPNTGAVQNYRLFDSAYECLDQRDSEFVNYMRSYLLPTVTAATILEKSFPAISVKGGTNFLNYVYKFTTYTRPAAPTDGNTFGMSIHDNWIGLRQDKAYYIETINGRVPISEVGMNRGANAISINNIFVPTLIGLPSSPITSAKFKLTYTTANGMGNFLLPLHQDFLNSIGLSKFGTGPASHNITVTEDIVSSGGRSTRFLTFHLSLQLTRSGNPQTKTISSEKYKLDTENTNFNFAFLPFIKGQSEYYVMFYDAKKTNPTLTFYNNGNPVNILRERARNPTPTESVKMYVVAGEFDLIQVDAGTGQIGTIIPIMEDVVLNTRQYYVGIDLGTTNTYIAIQKNDGAGLTNVNSSGNSSVYFSDEDIFKGYMQTQFVSPAMPHSFRSVLMMNENRARGQSDLFTGRNIAFGINDIAGNYANERPDPDIKWASHAESDFKIIDFVDELLLSIKLAILNDGGKYDDAYPLKIGITEPKNQGFINTSIAQTIQQRSGIILGNGMANAISVEILDESQAPLSYFLRQTNKRGFDTGTGNAVNIDIGGGTTDIVFRSSINTIGIASFKFAGNDLWRAASSSIIDGYMADNNAGFLFDRRNESKSGILINTLQTQLQKHEIVPALFKNIDLGFDSYVKGRRKEAIFFYLHYTSIIYYVAQVLKKAERPVPSNFSFTGQGSAYLGYLLGGQKQEIETFTTEFFKAMNDETLVLPNTRITIHRDTDAQISKEVTAKGVLLYRYNGDRVLYGGVLNVNPLNGIRCYFGTQNNIDERTYDDLNRDAEDAGAIDTRAEFLTTPIIMNELKNSISHYLTTLKSENIWGLFRGQFGNYMSYCTALDDTISDLENKIQSSAQDHREQGNLSGGVLFFAPMQTIFKDIYNNLNR
jgi:hypothetical protein